MTTAESTVLKEMTGMRIYKYPIELVSGPQTIMLPRTAKVLAFQMQDRGMFIWVWLDPDEGAVQRNFQLVGTGHDVPEHLAYNGTLQNGPYVWHLFEVAQ